VFGLGLATKIHVAVEAVDMRKGFEGLCGLVRDQLGQDPLGGHLFLFSNRTRTRLKALVWDLCEALGQAAHLHLKSAALFRLCRSGAVQ
jgi:transposase